MIDVTPKIGNTYKLNGETVLVENTSFNLETLKDNILIRKNDSSKEWVNTEDFIKKATSFDIRLGKRIK